MEVLNASTAEEKTEVHIYTLYYNNSILYNHNEIHITTVTHTYCDELSVFLHRGA